jgi:hypothetical protein
VKDTITSRGVTFRRPMNDEKAEQASIVNLTGQLGGRVYTLGSRRATCCGVCGSPSTDRSTRQTEGLGDLAIYLPPPRGSTAWVFLWIECKGREGTLTEAQVAFREINAAAHVTHLVGGLDAFLDFLEAGGWVRTRAVCDHGGR